MLGDTLFLTDRIVKHTRVCVQCREALVALDEHSLCTQGKLLHDAVIMMLKLDIALIVVNAMKP